MLQYPNCRFPRTISGSVSDTHTNRVIFTHWPSLKQTWPWPMAPKNWVGLETIRLPFGASWAYFFSGVKIHQTFDSTPSKNFCRKTLDPTIPKNQVANGDSCCSKTEGQNMEILMALKRTTEFVGGVVCFFG